MKTICTIIILMCSLAHQGYMQTKSIEKNGMRVTWTQKTTSIQFEISAPTNGWVAIGFNDRDQLIGTNLIMANIKERVTNCSDRYIVGIGDHRSVESLGGKNHLSNISGENSNQFISIRFDIEKNALDEYHFDLKKGKEIHLLLAYSMEDDFEHHSLMRTSIKIIL